MTMIRHNHKPIQKEWMPFLDEVQCLDCFSGTGRIGEDWLSAESIGCYQHHVLMLNGVSLKHGAILQAPRVDTRSHL